MQRHVEVRTGRYGAEVAVAWFFEEAGVVERDVLDAYALDSLDIRYPPQPDETADAYLDWLAAYINGMDLSLVRAIEYR